jgi:hypothetical protein
VICRREVARQVIEMSLDSAYSRQKPITNERDLHGLIARPVRPTRKIFRHSVPALRL